MLITERKGQFNDAFSLMTFTLFCSLKQLHEYSLDFHLIYCHIVVIIITIIIVIVVNVCHSTRCVPIRIPILLDLLRFISFQRIIFINCLTLHYASKPILWTVIAWGLEFFFTRKHV